MARAFTAKSGRLARIAVGFALSTNFVEILSENKTG